MSEEIADAISDAFHSWGENGKENVVTALTEVAYNANRIAKAITPQDASAGYDATGGTITSLTEAVMGITGGLVQIANAIQSLAESVNQKTS